MKRLKILRGNLSQEKIAQKLKVSQRAYSNYETGTREPDHNTLIRIADYFNVSLDYLLERTDTPGFSPAEQELGFSETKKEVVTQIEDDLLTEFRKLGETKGQPFQESVILYIKQLMNI